MNSTAIFAENAISRYTEETASVLFRIKHFEEKKFNCPKQESIIAPDIILSGTLVQQFFKVPNPASSTTFKRRKACPKFAPKKHEAVQSCRLQETRIMDIPLLGLEDPSPASASDLQ
ncbi:hypothetical protein PoB_001290000 [Plakobranchus ocellatus]|uniref:Uncharacterized protein n=1 Tax=Plakobranchus ocellatus TaxID=259542 RepID=A0AAV3YVC9_9GAST|nr:hypothetical protein PoB_001290000 [Plakobranchus ocellatus]